MSIRTLLTDYHQILSNFNNQYCEDNGSLLFEDLFPLKQGIELLSNKENLWEYGISPLKILVPYVPSHTIPTAENISVILQTDTIIQPVNASITDPVRSLNFDIQLIGSSTVSKSMMSLHLDKHSQITNPTDGEGDYLHPEYHFTFGGRKMEDAHHQNYWDFGQTLIMRSPRLMHPPMEIILGIDFILNQFIPREYISDLLGKPEYQNIVKEIKKVIWRPYALAFAKNFCHNWIEDTQHFTFDDTFCKSIIGEH